MGRCREILGVNKIFIRMRIIINGIKKMAKKKGLPKIKKTISAFLSNEEGRILKRSIITIGSVACGITIAKLLSDIIPSVEACSHGAYSHAWHSNTITAGYSDADCAIQVTHQLHSQHSSS